MRLTSLSFCRSNSEIYVGAIVEAPTHPSNKSKTAKKQLSFANQLLKSKQNSNYNKVFFFPILLVGIPPNTNVYNAIPITTVP
jgi:hypothetical protein